MPRTHDSLTSPRRASAALVLLAAILGAAVTSCSSTHPDDATGRTQSAVDVDCDAGGCDGSAGDATVALDDAAQVDAADEGDANDVAVDPGDAGDEANDAADASDDAADAADAPDDVDAGPDADASSDATSDADAADGDAAPDAEACASSCDDGNPCTLDACNAGTCTHANAGDGTSCNDGNACTQTDTCQAGACRGANPVLCGSGDACHDVGVCDPSSGVCSSPAKADGTSCDDGNLCTLGDVCQSGACAGTTPVQCAAADSCHAAGVCNPSTGTCTSPALADGTACNDGNACTQIDACLAGTCVGTSPVVCAQGDQCHAAGVCDPSSGACVSAALADGTACDDGNACTRTDACVAGACVGASPVVCAPSDACHLAGACDAKSGACSNPPAPLGTSCGDNTNLCVGKSTCNADGACTQGPPPQPSPPNRCFSSSCAPATGYVYTPIAGCDPTPVAAGDVFESRASLLGVVVGVTGAPVVGYALTVYDDTTSSPARTDVTPAFGGDGSFRARLTQFPDGEADGTPAHHLLVKIEAPDSLPVVRDAYAHPGDAIDLGKIVVVARDPNVTTIGAAGGTAVDSQGLVTVVIPPNALAAPTPIRVTPFREREHLPLPLPYITTTTYAVELEPNGTHFDVPVTVRFSNWRGVPTTATIPVGYADVTNARWLHHGFAKWDGVGFAYTTDHFSTFDGNFGLAYEWVYRLAHGFDPTQSQQGCMGSTVGLANGTLRQQLDVPGFQRAGRSYGLSLHYDSQSVGVPRQTTGQYGVTQHATVVTTSGVSISAACVPRGTGGGGSCGGGAGGSCLPGSTVSLPRSIAAGSSGTASDDGVDYTLPNGTSDFNFGPSLGLPIVAGQTAAPGYYPQHLTIHFVDGAAGACVTDGGAAGFGVVSNGGSAQPNNVQTNLNPGPGVSIDRQVFLDHRHTETFGTGWGLSVGARLHVNPWADDATLVDGSGTHERFYPRATGTVRWRAGGQVRVLARDPQTNEMFLADDTGTVLRLANGATTTQVTGPSYAGSPLAMTITYVGARRHFIVAAEQGLVDIAEGVGVTPLKSRTVTPPETLFRVAGVAARGGTVYYVDGINPTLYRIHLGATPQVDALSRAVGGDIGLDPRAALNLVQFGEPHGLVVTGDGSLYLADRARNAVYAIQADSSGEIGPGSIVGRAVGDGVGLFIAPIGERAPGNRFSLNQPVQLSLAPSGKIWIATTFGAALYDPGQREAKWMVTDADIVGGEQRAKWIGQNKTFSTAGVDDATLFVHDGIAVTEYAITPFSSEYAPTRTIAFNGPLATVTDTSADVIETYAQTTRWRYRLIERRARTGEGIFTLQYVDATSDKVRSIIDATGGTTTLDYRGGTKLATITDPAQRITYVDINDDGDLASFTLPDGEKWRFDYYPDHRIQRKTSPKGDVTTYEYNADGTVHATHKPWPGNGYTFEPIVEAHDAAGFTYRTTAYTDPRGVRHALKLNAQGEVDADTYVADGNTYAMQVVRPPVLEPSRDLREQRGNSILRRPAYTTVNGLVVGLETIFDLQGRIVEVGTGNPGEARVVNQSFAYDANGRLSVYYQGPGNDAFSIDRDGAGRPTRIWESFNAGTGATGRQTTYTWAGPYGQANTITQHGVLTTVGFDSNGNPSGFLDSLGRSISMGRDGAGNVTSYNDGATTWSYVYDASNRLRTATDALGNATIVDYTQPGCGCSEASLVSSVHTPDLAPGVAWRMLYGPEGRLTSVTDPDGRAETYDYERTGELKTVVDRMGKTTAIGHDALGRVTSILDTLNRQHARAYPTPGAAGLTGTSVLAGGASAAPPPPTSLTATLGAGDYQIGTRAFDTFSNDGGATTRTRGWPQVSFYQDATMQISYGVQLDGAGRTKRRDDRSGLPFAGSLVLDVTGAQSGLLTKDQVSWTSALPADLPNSHGLGGVPGAALYTYDTEYELTQTTGFGGASRTNYVEYDYTRDTGGRIRQLDRVYFYGSGFVAPQSTYVYAPNNDRLTQVVNADGTHVLHYDARGLLREIAITGEGSYVFDYDELGRNSKITYPDQHTREQLYDNEGRIRSRCYRYTGFQERCYTAVYDAVGNPSTLTDPEGTDDVGYDDLYRVRSVTRRVNGQQVGYESYDYNALGALKLNAPENGLVTALDDQRPRIAGGGTAPSAVMAKVNGVGVTVDAAGRITSLNGSTIGFDFQNKLTSITTGTLTENYHYDSYDRRVSREPSNGQSEYYVYEGANVVASLDSTGHVKDTYLYDGVDSPLRLKRAGSYYFYELDLAGNVRRIRGLNGPDLGGYRYTAFGQAIAGQAPAVDQPLRWKGRWYLDVAGGVYDVRARWWSPMLGSFLSVDEFAFHDEESTLWGWPGQNALTWSDPTGHRRSADENNAVFNAAERGELGDWAQTYAAAFRGRAEGMSMLSNDASVNAGLAKIRQAGCLFVLGGAQAIASAVFDIGLGQLGAADLGSLPFLTKSGGIARFPRHHVFPQALRARFDKLGFTRAFGNIDRFTVEVTRSEHEMLHWGQGQFGPGGWFNAAWNEFLATNPSPDQIWSFGANLISEAIGNRAWIPFRG